MPAAARSKLYSVYDNFKCPYEKILETYHMHLVYMNILLPLILFFIS